MNTSHFSSKKFGSIFKVCKWIKVLKKAITFFLVLQNVKKHTTYKLYNVIHFSQ